MLGHQLSFLPAFADFWNELEAVFGWLTGDLLAPALERLTIGSDVDDWAPARFMTTWRTAAPIELIRFAGANRLRIYIDYRPPRGRRGPRLVEPYSLRRSGDGELLLFVVNDRAELRSYRVDRIAGVSIEPERFEPRFRIEF